jgi:hypothetical protein
MSTLITQANHGFVTGEKVTINSFGTNLDLDSLNGRYFWVEKVTDNSLKLYYDITRTLLVNLVNTNINGAATVTSVEYTPTAQYAQPLDFSLDGRGILARLKVTSTLTAIATGTSITTSNLLSYLPGITDVNIVVPAGVIISAANTGSYALEIGAFNAADTVKLINLGSLIGRGGAAGVRGNNVGNLNGGPGGAAGTAINLNNNITLYNTGTIAGGGGGGGGGGGAVGQSIYSDPFGGYAVIPVYAFGGAGGAGAGPGAAVGGSAGQGGGGVAQGGAGGAGGNLGTIGNPGQTAPIGISRGSGGAGGAAGKAINLNGKTITYAAVGTINGAVS